MTIKNNFTMKSDNPDIEKIDFDASTGELSTTYTTGSTSSRTLNYSESRLLKLLLDNPGATLSRDYLTEYVWHERAIAGGSLSQAIFSLRTAMHDINHHNIIKTIPRRGYSFNQTYLIDFSSSSDQINGKESTIESVISGQSALLPQKVSLMFSSRLYLLIALTAALITTIYLLKESVNFFILHPVIYDTINSEEITINLIAPFNHNNSYKKNRQLLLAELQKIKSTSRSEVWVTADSGTYRVSCFNKYSTPYSVSIMSTDSLTKTVYKCIDGLSEK